MFLAEAVIKMRLSGSVTVSLAALASAHPGSTVKRQASQLRGSYDFVIIGGGTSGLTVADRLTAAFPKSESGAVPHVSQPGLPNSRIQKRYLSLSMVRSNMGLETLIRRQPPPQASGKSRRCQTPR